VRTYVIVAVATGGVVISAAGFLIAFVDSVAMGFRRVVGNWTEQHARWAIANDWALSATAIRLYGLGLLFTAPIFTVLAAGSALRRLGWLDASFLVLPLLVGELVVIAASATSFARFQLSRKLSRKPVSAAPGLPLIAAVTEGSLAIGGIVLWLALGSRV